MLAPVIDDAHLMTLDCLRKIRLLFEDIPKNHNLILAAQPELLRHVSLSGWSRISPRCTASSPLETAASARAKPIVTNSCACSEEAGNVKKYHADTTPKCRRDRTMTSRPTRCNSDRNVVINGPSQSKC